MYIRYHLKFVCLVIYKPYNQDNIFLKYLFSSIATMLFINSYSHKFMNHHTLSDHKFTRIFYNNLWPQFYYDNFMTPITEIINYIWTYKSLETYADSNLQTQFCLIVAKSLSSFTWERYKKIFFHMYTIRQSTTNI